MGVQDRPRGPATGLMGRRAERGVLDGLLAAVRAGQSRVLVVRGEPGVGKTALLEYLAGQADGCRVLRVAGVQSEMELAYAGVHQLCAPLLDRLRVLPGPQRQALRTAFGMSAGPAPDRFLVGLAVLVDPLMRRCQRGHQFLPADNQDHVGRAPGVRGELASRG